MDCRASHSGLTGNAGMRMWQFGKIISICSEIAESSHFLPAGQFSFSAVRRCW
jgi:hypothetical protein